MLALARSAKLPAEARSRCLKAADPKATPPCCNTSIRGFDQANRSFEDEID